MKPGPWRVFLSHSSVLREFPSGGNEQAGAPLSCPDCIASIAFPSFAPHRETRTPPEWLACGSGPGDRPGSSDLAKPRRTQVPCRRQPSGRPWGQGQQPVARLRPRTRGPGLAVERRRGYGGDVPSGGTLSEEPQGLAGESGPETRAGLNRITSTGTLAAGARGANRLRWRLHNRRRTVRAISGWSGLAIGSSAGGVSRAFQPCQLLALIRGCRGWAKPRSSSTQQETSCE